MIRKTKEKKERDRGARLLCELQGQESARNQSSHQLHPSTSSPLPHAIYPFIQSVIHPSIRLCLPLSRWTLYPSINIQSAARTLLAPGTVVWAGELTECKEPKQPLIPRHEVELAREQEEDHQIEKEQTKQAEGDDDDDDDGGEEKEGRKKEWWTDTDTTTAKLESLPCG